MSHQPIYRDLGRRENVTQRVEKRANDRYIIIPVILQVNPPPAAAQHISQKRFISPRSAIPLVPPLPAGDDHHGDNESWC